MDIPLRTRRPQLREQLLREGVHSLSDAQLLSLVLGTGSRSCPVELASFALLQFAGSLTRLANQPIETLAVAGVGPAKAARVLAALEMGRRAASASPAPSFVKNERDVAEWARPRLVGLEHEEVWMLSLDARNRLKGTTRLAQGGMHGCALTPQDVLRPAVRNAASGIVLVHNHPSGDPTPSEDDLRMTETLAKACDLVGIALLDHVVVARDGVRSIAAMLSAED